jgi:beta-N-acetylhexosaminidase
MRRGGTLALLAVVLVACSTANPATPSPTPTASASQTATPSAAPSASARSDPAPGKRRCRNLAASLTPAQRVGQLFLVGAPTWGTSSSDLALLDRNHIGNVLLLYNSTAGRAATSRVINRIRRRARSPKGIQLLLAADQEGGLVQRLKGRGFSDMPSAESQGRLSDEELTRRARKWGRELKQAGIDLDLAPVADVVPKRWRAVNQPIGQLRRSFSANPDVVAAKVAAFVAAMHQAGIATAVKHFPGLGRVRGNTDTAAHVVDRQTTRHDALLAGFRAGIDAGSDLVMISSATYSRIDPGEPAAFSRAIINTMLRGDLGFQGVIVSDDFVGAALSDVAPGTGALRFLQAGGDLLIVGKTYRLQPMVDAVNKAADRHRGFAAKITEKAARVLQVKARYGLADCQ